MDAMATAHKYLSKMVFPGALLEKRTPLQDYSGVVKNQG